MHPAGHLTEATDPHTYLLLRERVLLCSTGTLGVPQLDRRGAGGVLAGAVAISRLVLPRHCGRAARTAIWTSRGTAIPSSLAPERTCVSSPHPGPVLGPAGSGPEAAGTQCSSAPQFSIRAIWARLHRKALYWAHQLGKSSFHYSPWPAPVSLAPVPTTLSVWAPAPDLMFSHKAFNIVDQQAEAQNSRPVFFYFF